MAKQIEQSSDMDPRIWGSRRPCPPSLIAAAGAHLVTTILLAVPLTLGIPNARFQLADTLLVVLMLTLTCLMFDRRKWAWALCVGVEILFFLMFFGAALWALMQPDIQRPYYGEIARAAKTGTVGIAGGLAAVSFHAFACLLSRRGKEAFQDPIRD